MPVIPWWKKLHGEITIHTYDHNFGIVVPYPSGFKWEQQTQGVLCHHVEIEGVFIPLPYPKKILDKIQTSNYYGLEIPLKEAWEDLKKFLREREYLEFEEVEAPKGFPPNQEGLQWIKIKKWKSIIDERNKLEGKIVALYYPNSD